VRAETPQEFLMRQQRVLFVVVVPRLAVPFGSASVARL